MIGDEKKFLDEAEGRFGLFERIAHRVAIQRLFNPVVIRDDHVTTCENDGTGF
jgi:hypothetical protein